MTLKELQQKLAAKQKAIFDVFQASGDDRDFAADEVLTLTGAKDSAGAVDVVRAWNSELDAIGTEIDAKAELETIAANAAKRRTEPAKGSPALPDPEKPVEVKSLGRMIVESAAFESFRKTRTPCKGFVEGAGMKTLFQTSAGWAPESIRVPGLVIDAVTRPIQVLDIIPPGVTDQANIVYMAESTRTHASAERAENAAYAESTFALTETTSTVRSIGTSIPVTDEQLEDVAGVQSYLEQRLVFGNRQRLDLQVLQGDGSAPNLRGILNTGSIQTQAKGVDSVPDAVYKAMDLVRVTGRAFPNAFVVHPTDWQAVRLLTTSDGIYIWGSPSEAGPQRIWGIQVVLSDALTENTGLVGDFANFCQMFERRGMEVAVGFVNDDFLDGRQTIRAGFRVAFVVYRATAFCTVTGI